MVQDFCFIAGLVDSYLVANEQMEGDDEELKGKGAEMMRPADDMHREGSGLLCAILISCYQTQQAERS